MNILHINTNYLSNALHQNMINTMEKKGVSNTVFVPTYAGSPRGITPANNVIVSGCFNKWDRVNYYSKQKKIINSVKSSVNVKDFDIVHAYTVFTDGNVAYRLYKEYGIPYVVAVRNTDINTFFKYMLHLRKRGIEILKNASAVFFLSKVYKERLFENYIKPDDAKLIDAKSYIMPNGIDDFWLENLYDEKDFSNDDGVIKVACVGSIEQNKNMLSVARALELLKQKGKKVSLSIAGKINDQNIFGSLKKYDFVEYKGVLPKEKLIDVYSASDVFILVSFKESFGMVYIEALSQGLPLVYTEGEGFDGQFEDGKAGYSTNPSDIEEIADKIMKAYNSRQEIYKNSADLVQGFSWDSITKRYIDIYNNISDK